ncbi:hypothetical protein McanMca71_005393 [Microsporum canis]
MDAKAWSLKCIQAGETNIKGYLLTCVIVAHVEALLKDPTKDLIAKLLVNAIEDASAKSLSILDGMEIPNQAENPVGGLSEILLHNVNEMADDWGFMVAGSIFDLDSGGDTMGL